MHRRIPSSSRSSLDPARSLSLAALPLVALLSPSLVLDARARAESDAPEIAPAEPDLPPPPARTPVAELAPLWVALGAGSLGLGVGLFLVPSSPPGDPSVGVWRGGMLLDEDFRLAAHAGSRDGERIARTVSDVMLVATMANAALIDSALIPALHEDPDLVWQASAAHATALGLMLAVGSVVKLASVRARPYERQCAEDPAYPGCGSGDSYRSFFSLHSGVAFTSAGFSCAMHLERTLYDDLPADVVACGGAIAAAATTGLMRVVADAHYLSDVLVGAALGFAIGYLVPLAIVPARLRRARDRDARDRAAGESIPRAPSVAWSLAPILELGPPGTGTVTAGASIGGTF